MLNNAQDEVRRDGDAQEDGEALDEQERLVAAQSKNRDSGQEPAQGVGCECNRGLSITDPHLLHTRFRLSDRLVAVCGAPRHHGGAHDQKQ